MHPSLTGSRACSVESIRGVERGWFVGDEVCDRKGADHDAKKREPVSPPPYVGSSVSSRVVVNGKLLDGQVTMGCANEQAKVSERVVPRQIVFLTTEVVSVEYFSTAKSI